MMIPLKSTSLVLVMISNMSVPICNRFHDKQANSRKITIFRGGTPIWHSPVQTSLNVGGRDLECCNLHSMAKNFIHSLCWFISNHFGAIHSLKSASQLEIAKNSLKPLILGVQGHSRSSILTFLRSPSPVLVMISSMLLLICNYFYARRANTGKITPF